ncbi:Kynurenine formamidase [Allomyces arbusculus]|nr:Kynurenine formamidase [Allomyces arbusculus]
MSSLNHPQSAVAVQASKPVELVEVRNVLYVNAGTGTSIDPAHHVDLYLWPNEQERKNRPLIVFLHGGAWRSNSRADFTTTAHLLARATHCAVAVPGYRLSLPADSPTRPQHPSHAVDAHAAITYLSTQSARFGYDPSRIILVGHSAGAHMAAFAAWSLNAPNVVGVIGVDGIYDIVNLVDEYPDYRGFIEQAFGSDERSWTAASAVALAETKATGLVAVVHSPDDELLTFRQSDLFLVGLQKRVGVEVVKEYAAVTGKHDELLKTDAFATCVAGLVDRAAARKA